MHDAVGGVEVGGRDLGVIDEDGLDPSPVTPAQSPPDAEGHVVSVGRGSGVAVVDGIGEDLGGEDVVEQKIGELVRVGDEELQAAVWQMLEGLVGGREDGQWTTTVQGSQYRWIGSSDGRDESSEVIPGGDLEDGLILRGDKGSCHHGRKKSGKEVADELHGDCVEEEMLSSSSSSVADVVTGGRPRFWSECSSCNELVFMSCDGSASAGVDG
mmetsp:Transcript_3842/g.10186  ORF Transcript_3842/g.10186 Transcript_3842/m.10186 type:complete len:213 (+) Transcript_3842:1597-2235(+)